jgi:hypothetical protein
MSKGGGNMFRKCLAVLGLAAALVWTASAQDAKAVIGNASRAMGVDALKTVQYSATGLDFALGQAPNPASPWPKFINKSYTRMINFDTPASRVDRVRVQGENPPHGFLRAAATKNATVEARTMGGKKYHVVTFVGDNKAKVNGYINAQNMLERVETWIDNPFLGDMLFEAIYSDYKDAGGAPAAAAAPANPPAQSEKLGDGVYLITGGYAVIAVDFKDYIALVESGQNEPRALAVVAEAKRLMPGKPIKYLINTHSHIDHSSGLRGFVAEGSTILAHQVNKAYLEKILSAPHTLNPDKVQ